MKGFDEIKNVYFLGIGGIGMSALAHYFVLHNKRVAGYDKTPGKTTAQLQSKGVELCFDDEVERIPETFLDTDKTLIIYTPAIPEDLKLLQFFKFRDYRLEKRSQILGDISNVMPTLAVAGTHGKTTTSAILAHLLKQADYKITAFLGGICENYQSNFIGDGNEACVVEADEYDRSFLKLSPQYVAINAMDPDHLDIYQRAEELEKSFQLFAKKVPNHQHLFFKKGLPLSGNSLAVEDSADYEVQDVQIIDGQYHFNFKTPSQVLTDLEFTIPGRHNLQNAGMALAMALDFGADPAKLAKGLKSFKGVDRRFTYHLKQANLVLIEDYAHHPEELRAICAATREMYPNKKITAVFQPHLYSRTRDFAQGFADSLAAFDQIVLLPIYPAREQPIPGIDSAFLLNLIKNADKKIVTKKELPAFLITQSPEVVLMLGAGDIGNEVQPVKKALLGEN